MRLLEELCSSHFRMRYNVPPDLCFTPRTNDSTERKLSRTNALVTGFQYFGTKRLRLLLLSLVVTGCTWCASLDILCG